MTNQNSVSNQNKRDEEQLVRKLRSFDASSNRLEEPCFARGADFSTDMLKNKFNPDFEHIDNSPAKVCCNLIVIKYIRFVLPS